PLNPSQDPDFGSTPYRLASIMKIVVRSNQSKKSTVSHLPSLRLYQAAAFLPVRCMNLVGSSRGLSMSLHQPGEIQPRSSAFFLRLNLVLNRSSGGTSLRRRWSYASRTALNVPFLTRSGLR